MAYPDYLPKFVAAFTTRGNSSGLELGVSIVVRSLLVLGLAEAILRHLTGEMKGLYTDRTDALDCITRPAFRKPRTRGTDHGART